MTSQFKIRFLLLLLALTFAGTALTINLTFQKEEVLSFEAQRIENRLHRKEKFVKNYFNKPSTFDSLRNIENNDLYARQVIANFKETNKIHLQTFKKGKLTFWSDIKIIEEVDTNIHEGSSFIKWKNGWYETIKKTDGDFTAVCCIPIKWDYPYENKYLRNTFSEDLITEDNLEIAKINDRPSYTILNSDGKFLFSVRLKSSINTPLYSNLEVAMWFLSVLFLLIFINYLCVWITNKGYLLLAIILLSASFITIRVLNLHYNFYFDYFNIELFNPRNYATSFLYPSIGDFLLNTVYLTWILTFVYNNRKKIKVIGEPISRFLSYVSILFIGLLLSAIAYYTHDAFYGLITNSNIDFDVTNILNLSWLSWVGILILCFGVLNIFLLIEISLILCNLLTLTNKERLSIFMIGVLIALLNTIYIGDFNIYVILFAVIILFRGWSIVTSKNSDTGILIFTILLFSIISAAKLSQFQFIKEREHRKVIAQKLEAANDPNAVLLFLNLEKEILNNPFITNYFTTPIYSHITLSNLLKKNYFDGYLSRYDFKIYEYNALNGSLRGGKDHPLSLYKELVLSGAIKVSHYFYRVNNTFGFQNYFALLPINNAGDNLGTLVIELKSKRLDSYSSYPQLLIDGKIKENLNIDDYSFAFYNDNKLLNQHGEYIYALTNRDFNAKLNGFHFFNKIDIGPDVEYSHLVYRTSNRKIIVVSKKINSAITQLAGASFLFIIFLLFTFIIICLKWLWKNLMTYSFHPRNFQWDFLFANNRVLYKTRIQLSMVGAVVITLLITGGITFYNISAQYRSQQKDIVIDKVKKIAEGFNKQLFDEGNISTNEQTITTFNTFSDVNAADLNLFDINGNLILTTQPKIYNTLIADKMNALAFVYLSKLQKSEYINQEQIGRLKFITGYATIRNERNESVAYLGLPYFENESDYHERINLFLNALINIYALVFVAIGFLAVFLANQITSPLTLIQSSLSKIKIGSKNEPLRWTRNDEIGNLIKEYNTMIEELEISASKLAKSERETAWREMAKQIAHEIKNPLTPLKLGVQLLEKSWKEKDANFDAKFQRFSKSFVEQIESLSQIASAFSNFAKMPDIILKKINIVDVIVHTTDLYNQMENISIKFNNQAGKTLIIMADNDQLIRSFNNLLKNAVESIPEGKKGLIEISLKAVKDNLFIEVKDNGSGIPDHLIDNIFVPNFTTKSSGTGLGLAFVKQAVQNINGSINFETNASTGTTFFITIPLVT